MPCALYMLAMLTIHLLVLHAFHIFSDFVLASSSSAWASYGTYLFILQCLTPVSPGKAILSLMPLNGRVYSISSFDKICISICLPTIYSCLFPFLFFLTNLNSVRNGTISFIFHSQCLLQWLTHSGCLINICCN